MQEYTELVCPHGCKSGKNCEVCSLVYEEFGSYPTIYDPMPEEISIIEDQLSNKKSHD